MNEWDEKLIAEREYYFHQCNDEACQAGQQVVRIARAQHAEVARLTAARDARERDYEQVIRRAQDARAELSRLRAVVEEARVKADRAYWLGVNKNKGTTLRAVSDLASELISVLDRGLEGSGE